MGRNYIEISNFFPLMENLFSDQGGGTNLLNLWNEGMFESPDKPQDDADSWAHAAAVLQEIVNESQSSESSESVTYRNWNAVEQRLDWKKNGNGTKVACYKTIKKTFIRFSRKGKFDDLNWNCQP